MMEATLRWPYGIGTNRSVGRGPWTWLDLADPLPGGVLLAGTATRGHWPFPADLVTRADRPAALIAALTDDPSLIALDDSLVGPDVVPRLIAAVERGATVMIERSDGGPTERPEPLERMVRSVIRLVRRSSGKSQPSPASDSTNLDELVDALGLVTAGRLVPAGDEPSVGHGRPSGATRMALPESPTVLMVPDISDLSGPTLHRWRAEPTSAPVRAPFLILPRAWSAIPDTVARLTGDEQTTTADAPPWEYGPPRGYATQKSVFFINGGDPVVVKQSRDPLGSRRLAAEVDALRRVERMREASEPGQVMVPRVIGAWSEPGRTVVAESSLAGPSLLDLLGDGGDITLAAPLVEFLIGHGVSSRQETGPIDRAEAYGAIVDRFSATFPLHRRTRSRVAVAAARISRVGAPAVEFHGDFTPWNLVRTDDAWAVHDWENADAAGPPLWDLILFTIGVVKAIDGPTSPGGLARQLTSPGVRHGLMSEWTSRYCREVGIEPALVPDLWVTALAHEAVKEATRARRARSVTGRSLRLLLALRHAGDLPGGRTP